jgi:hypothetical protein
MPRARHSRACTIVGTSSLSTASIAPSIASISGPALASIAFEMMKNHDSSSLPVAVWSATMFSGCVRSASSLRGLQFHKFRAAYVATGCTSRCAEVWRKGIVMAGGNRYIHCQLPTRLQHCRDVFAYFRWFGASPDITLSYDSQH